MFGGNPAGLIFCVQSFRFVCTSSGDTPYGEQRGYVLLAPGPGDHFFAFERGGGLLQTQLSIRW